MKLPGGMNLQQMMKQAQKMQEQMAKEMDALHVDATAGGGIVKVEMNGNKEVLTIKIDPEAASDIEMLQDLVVAAINECGRKVDETMQNKLGGALGGNEDSRTNVTTVSSFWFPAFGVEITGN